MTACPPDQRRPLRRVSDEQVSLAQHVGHDTAVDDRLSWRAADLGAAVERPATQKRYTSKVTKQTTVTMHICMISLVAAFCTDGSR